MTTAQNKEEERFYRDALATASSGPASTGYGHPVNQAVRFQVADRYIPPGHDWANERETNDHDWSLLDVGCGTGDLLSHLIDRGQDPSRYLGVDLMPEMTAATKKVIDERLHYEADEDWRTWCGDIRNAIPYEFLPPNDEPFDVAVSIATLALCPPEWEMRERFSYVRTVIEQMVLYADKTVLVTLFSTQKNNHQPNELNLDPSHMLTWALSQYDRVELIHSYAPHDFALVIHLDDGEWWNKHGLVQATRR